MKEKLEDPPQFSSSSLLSPLSLPLTLAMSCNRIKYIFSSRSQPTVNSTLILLALILLLLLTQSITSSNNVDNFALISPNHHISPSSSNLRGQPPTTTSDKVLPQPTALIVIACHAILNFAEPHPPSTPSALKTDSAWHLLDYQKNTGLPNVIIAHIIEGIYIASLSEDSVLTFSGGATRRDAGSVTEGGSYFIVAESLNLWNPSASVVREYKKGGKTFGAFLGSVRRRTVTEEYAMDSFQNLMFSVARFHEFASFTSSLSYPRKITVISFTYKETRFVDHHRSAINYPAENFEYVGIDPTGGSNFDLTKATSGELQNSLLPFTTDPYGCHTAVLKQKRKERNPFSRVNGYSVSCAEMVELLEYCGPGLFVGRLPWNE